MRMLNAVITGKDKFKEQLAFENTNTFSISLIYTQDFMHIEMCKMFKATL